ncbi:MAG TPA: ABC transporter ATP-binding protein [Feifaniaceae bacterium]|nr:ABC transporter ATP-binding protein [Feifaniaceae bacterium]
MNVLELSHVSKRFGSREVLKDLSFSVPEHTIYGFIGENGAGKTTTMKLILGLLPQDGGEIRVCGEQVRYGQTKTNRHVGYLPDVPEFYGYLTPAEYLTLCGNIAGMQPVALKSRVDELVNLVGLESSASRRINGFSRGMKQRLGIAQALIHRPKLLICDEPTSALDPAGRKDVIDILKTIKHQTTVLFSTHILSDVERICDEIGLLHNGSMRLEGKLEEIRQLHAGSGYAIEFQDEADAVRFAVAFPGGEAVSSARLLFASGTQQEMSRAMGALSVMGICPVKMELCEPSLESLFLEVAGA